MSRHMRDICRGTGHLRPHEFDLSRLSLEGSNFFIGQRSSDATGTITKAQIAENEITRDHEISRPLARHL